MVVPVGVGPVTIGAFGNRGTWPTYYTNYMYVLYIGGAM